MIKSDASKALINRISAVLPKHPTSTTPNTSRIKYHAKLISKER